MEEGIYVAAVVKCDLCSHIHFSIHPIDDEKIECPRCENESYHEEIPIFI